MNHLNVLKEKTNILENEIKEKNFTIDSLSEEIIILKSIIEEKDKTIDSLGGR